MEEVREPRFGFWKSVSFSLVLIALFLGLAELAVRGWSFYLRADAERFEAETGTFVLVPGEHRSGSGFARINSQGFVGAELKPDGPDLWQVAALGDSCTYGGGNDRDTYPSMLRGLLEDLEWPGRRYDVVNAGISGLNSELALRRLRTAVLPLRPEVVTIYIGWNDLMKFDPVGQQGSARGSRLALALDRLWLVKGMRKLLFYHVRPRVRPPRTGPESRTGRFAAFRPPFYEENVRAMVAAARESGSRPALLTLPSVLRIEMTAEDLRGAGVFFPYYPAAYAVGDLLDLIAAYNASIRRLARDEEVALIDLARVFQQLDDPRPYFWDTMHPSRPGMRIIAREILIGLEREGLLGR